MLGGLKPAPDRRSRGDGAAARVLLLGLLLLLLSACASRRLDPQVGVTIGVRDPGFERAFARVSETEWTEGNEVLTLINGDGYYPPMLEAIESAQTSITFETFAYVDGPITRAFTEAMARKAREGIPVLMIVDQVGSRHIGEGNESLLRSSGVRYFPYHPLNPLRPLRTNNRTHRKILVVDGKRGFTGGAGFALAWEGDAHSEHHWRDTQYEVNGPAVAQLQRAFVENWEELTGEALEGSAFFPALGVAGAHRAQFVYDSPSTPSNPIAHTFLHAINSARESLVLEQSYFIPNRKFKSALIAAAERGVKVDLLVPSERIDSIFTRYASQNSWRALLEAGVRIFQYRTTMMHGKLLIADGVLSIVGSGNMDDRSFYINDEVNLHVLSERFAEEQKAMFLEDLKRCQEVTLENLDEILEPWIWRFLAWFGAPQL